MDHLISIGKVVVKEDRRCQRKHRKARRHLPRAKAKDQQQPATDFEGNGDCPTQRRQRQTYAADVGCRRPEGRKLAEAAHEERQTNKDATKQWQKSCSFHVRLFSRHLRRRYTMVGTETANCHRRGPLGMLYDRKVYMPTIPVNRKCRAAPPRSSETVSPSSW